MRGQSYKSRGDCRLLALTSLAVAHAQSSNPACQRLEAQLATLDRGNTDPARVEQIRRIEDTVNRQQFEVDRLVAQSRRIGCENSGFFSIFSNLPPQCGGLNRQIDQQRNALERMRNDLERLNGGTTERAAQRRGILIALGDNGCGAQYRSAALAGQQGGFWDRLFGDNGGGSVVSTPLGPMGGTFRTVCVRTCDGFYFPISYSTSPDRFRDDEQSCQRMCPAVRSFAIRLSQSRRGNGAGGFAQWQTLYRASDRLPVSQGGGSCLQLSPARGKLGANAQGPRPGRYGRSRRRGRHRAERQTTLPTADRRRWQANPARTAYASTRTGNCNYARGFGSSCGGADQTAPAKRTVRTVGPTFLPTR